MRYVNLKNLPKRIDSLGREIIDWENCYGEKCYFGFDFIKTSIMSSPFPSIYNIYNINFKEAHKFACYTNKIYI